MLRVLEGATCRSQPVSGKVRGHPGQDKRGASYENTRSKSVAEIGIASTHGQAHMTAYCFCTPLDRSYLTRGLALYHSLARHCRRPFSLWVLCFDDETYQTLYQLDLRGVRLIRQQDLEASDADLEASKANRSPVEQMWSSKPSLLLHVLRRHPEAEAVTYLDGDLLFSGDPRPLYSELGDGSILLVEHRFGPGHAHMAAITGRFNAGFVVFRRDEHSLACLRWWRERCLEWCHAHPEDGKFADQKYLDDWPRRFEGVVVAQHKGANLAPWNLTRYQIFFGTDGTSVDGQPLLFYHYHGYRTISRWLVRPCSSRYSVSSEQAKRIYLPYAHALYEAEGGLTQVPVGAGLTSAREIAKALLREPLLLTRPELLTPLSWQISGWRLGLIHSLRRAGAYAKDLAGRASSRGERGPGRPLPF